MVILTVTISDILQNSFYKYFTFIHNLHIILRIFINIFKMDKCFLICITLFVIITHLGWSGGIDLGPGSVLLLEVSSSIPSSANLDGLI